MKTEIERLKKASPNQTAKERFKAAALNVFPIFFVRILTFIPSSGRTLPRTPRDKSRVLVLHIQAHFSLTYLYFVRIINIYITSMFNLLNCCCMEDRCRVQCQNIDGNQGPSPVNPSVMSSGTVEQALFVDICVLLDQLEAI